MTDLKDGCVSHVKLVTSILQSFASRVSLLDIIFMIITISRMIMTLVIIMITIMMIIMVLTLP